MLRVLGGLALMAALGVGGALAYFGDEPLRQSGLAPDWPSITGEPVVQASATREASAATERADPPRQASAAASAPAPAAVAAAPAAAVGGSSRFSPEFVSAIGASLETSAAAQRDLSNALTSTRERLAETNAELESARADARSARLALATERDEKEALMRSLAVGGETAGDPAAQAQQLAALRTDIEAQVRRELRPTLEREIETSLRASVERSVRAELQAAGVATGSGSGGSVTVGSGTIGSSLGAAATGGAAARGALETALASVNAAVCGRPRGPRGPDDVFAILEGETQPYLSYIDGAFAPQDSFPWAASLKVVERPADRFGEGEIAQRCGGAVIDSGWVVTAAHCLTPGVFDHVEIAVGSTDLYSADVVRVSSRQALCHSGYDHRYFSLANDIALIPLERPLPQRIPSVDVATPEFVFSLAYETPTNTAGWGAPDVEVDGAPTSASQYLKAVALELKDVHGAHLYASDDTPLARVCKSDSGGPLSVGAGPDATLIGIASHVHTEDGKFCATTDDLSVFTNVGLYREWIDSVMSLCATREDC